VRIGLLADVHANLPALEAVLDALGEADVDAYACAGDLVGFGPHPNDCVARIAALPRCRVVAGHHDLAAIGRLTAGGDGALERETTAWTREHLAPEAAAVLEQLPRLARSMGGVVVAHGTLQDVAAHVPEAERARTQLAAARELVPGATVLVVGHTHQPLAVGEQRGVLLRESCGRVEQRYDEALVVNPGSVGQSHTRDPRARFAVLDTRERFVEFDAVEYDLAAVRRDLRRAGLAASSCNPRHGPLPMADALLRAAGVMGRRVRKRAGAGL
jgi:predicted phosphodiesterase